MKGYCSDCLIFVKCPWFCNRYDPETENPHDGHCWSKEPMPVVEEDKENKE